MYSPSKFISTEQQDTLKYLQTHPKFPEKATALKLLGLRRYTGKFPTLPPHLTEIEYSWKHPLHRGQGLPSSLTHIILGPQFNKPLQYLPPALTHVTFGDSFRHPFNLPDSVVYIKFGSMFNSVVTSRNLPSSLKYLAFGREFDCPIDDLPPSLTHLVIGAFSYF